MAIKISELTVSNHEDIENLYTLGYYDDSSTDTKSNFKINQKNLLNKIWDISFSNENKKTLKDIITNLEGNISNISNDYVTSEDLQNSFNITDEVILDFINEKLETGKENTSVIETFQTIIATIKELHENQLGDDESENEDNENFRKEIENIENNLSKIDDRVETLENNIGITLTDEEIISKSQDIISITNGKPIDISVVEITNIDDKTINFESDVNTFNEIVKRIAEKNDPTCSNKNNLDTSLSDIKLSKNNIDSFIGSNKSYEIALQYEENPKFSEYEKLTEEPLNEYINDKKSILENISKLVDADNSETFYAQWIEIYNNLNSSNPDTDNISELKDLIANISETYSELYNTVLKINGWQIKDDKNFINELAIYEKNFTLEELTAKDVDGRSKLDKINDLLNSISKDIVKDGRALSDISVFINDNIKDINREISNINNNFVESDIDINNGIKELTETYERLKDKLVQSAKVNSKVNVAIEDIKNTATTLKTYIENSGTAGYINQLLGEIKVFNNNDNLDDFFQIVNKVIKSEGFIIKGVNETEINKLFIELKDYYNHRAYYYSDLSDIRESLIEIHIALNNPNLIKYCNEINKFDSFLESTLNQNNIELTESIQAELDIVKNNIINISVSNTPEQTVTDLRSTVTTLGSTVTTLGSTVTTLGESLEESNNIISTNISKLESTVTTLGESLDNSSGFVDYGKEVTEENTEINGIKKVNAEKDTVNKIDYYKYTTSEPGILYIVKKEVKNESNTEPENSTDTLIKFIPFSTDENGKIKYCAIYENIYYTNGLNMPLITLPLYKGQGILLEYKVDPGVVLYFAPYMNIIS